MKKVGIVLSIVALLVLAVAVEADCNRARVIVQQHHAQAVIVQQQHHAVNYNHAQAVQFVPVAISPDYYYSTNDYYRTLVQAKLIAGELRQQESKAPIQQQQTPCPCPQQNQPAGQQAKASTGINEKLVALVNARCIKCHQGPAPGGGLSLENLDAVPKGSRWTSHGLVNAGEMPKGGQPISDDEVKLFVEWAKAAR